MQQGSEASPLLLARKNLVCVFDAKTQKRWAWAASVQGQFGIDVAQEARLKSK